MKIIAILIMLGMSAMCGFVGGTGFEQFTEWYRYAFLLIGAVMSLLWAATAFVYAYSVYKGEL